MDTKQRILHNTHAWLVALWRHDLPWNRHDLLDLGLRLERLRHVHVHLVAIEIGVVWRSDGKIKTEGLEW